MIRRTPSPLRSLAALALLVPALAACGGAGSAAAPPSGPKGSPLAEVKRAKVYDAAGKEQECAPPEASCPPLAPDRELADRCALAGYRIVQCGCEARCTGDVSRKASHYDAEGQAKVCEPAKPDCSPEPAKAAFQDACTERGYHLQVCGCEWLCSGKLDK